MNFVNLLDLRPGRAIKGFGIMLLLISGLTWFSQIQFILPVISVLVLYIKGEMKEFYMLGDTGANLLGGILGFYGVLALTPIAKGCLLIALLFLQLFAEYHSLSAIIAEHPLLKKMDMLGRKQEE